MANVIKLNKGLDINLKGRAEEKKIQLKSNGKFALAPDDFEGVTPKVVVREGDKVKAGDLLMEVDLDALEAANKPSATMVIVTNTDAFKAIAPVVGPIKAGQASCKLTK